MKKKENIPKKDTKPAFYHLNLSNSCTFSKFVNNFYLSNNTNAAFDNMTVLDFGCVLLHILG